MTIEERVTELFEQREKERRQRYYQQNKERIKAANKARRERLKKQDPEGYAIKQREYSRISYRNNIEKAKEKNQKWREENRGKVNAAAKARYWANIEENRAKQREYRRKRKEQEGSNGQCT